ncbi:MAG TPA: DUF4364 family protein [Papillibacter sp.]|jgi:predicted transcriptional regulator|nr:DUF4364 family protein [Papillibacter sp.]
MEQRLGFIHDKIEIKILILFILRRLPEPVTLDTLGTLTLCDGGITYFDFTECLAELVETGHIETDGHTYIITEKGRINGEITENSLPYTVRAKAEESTKELSVELMRRSAITTSRTIRRKGGYTVHLALSDGVSEICAIELFAASEEQAKALENGFSENAERIYNGLIKLILQEK